MNPSKPSPSTLDWPSAIGNFLLNFGTLDYFVFCFLKDHLPEEEFINVKEWHFKDRLKKMGQQMRAANKSSEQQAEFAHLAERLEPIRELRNHIAHGHMLLRIDEMTKQPTVTVFRAKDLDTQRMADARHVEFAELLRSLKELTELTEGFKRLAGFKKDGLSSF